MGHGLPPDIAGREGPQWVREPSSEPGTKRMIYTTRMQLLTLPNFLVVPAKATRKREPRAGRQPSTLHAP
jgi:hypothetical protein